ncbi:NADP-dependent oxidoreductase (plasmid) [Burkholderia sp. M6-3]
MNDGLGPVRQLPATMRAVQIDAFGGADAMQYVELPVPRPTSGQLLIKISAAGVGPWDACIRSGKSALAQRLPLTPGSDISGTVVSTGPDLTGWSVGDEVFGGTNPRFTNGYAEYAVADAAMLAIKPPEMNAPEAASVPVIAVTAWQMLFEFAKLQPGQRVLVYGAAGNVGSYAVMLAAQAGARVIATASQTQAQYVRSLGAEEVVDPRTSPLHHLHKRVDVVVDLVGPEAIARSFDLVKTGGVLVSAVAEPDKQRARNEQLTAGCVLVSVTTERLSRIADLFALGKLRTRVGEVLPLWKAREAHQMMEEGRQRPGKIILLP